MDLNLGGGIEAVNRSVDPIFTNTSNNDVCVYADSSNQALHLGVGGSTGSRASMVTVTQSNVTVNGDLTASAIYADNLGDLASFRNRFINGAIQVDQRHAFSNVVVSGTSTYVSDRWVVSNFGGIATTVSKSNVTDLTGFNRAITNTVLTAQSVASGTNICIPVEQRIEGLNIADLRWGSALAAPITVSFFIKSSVAHTYHVALRNSALNQSYVVPVPITQTNTWSRVSIPVPGPTTGTWLSDNTTGVTVGIVAMGGSSLATSSPSSWITGNFVTTTAFGNNTTFTSTLNNNVSITGLQFEKGTRPTGYEMRPYSMELLLSQRYFEFLTFLPGTTAAIYWDVAGTATFPGSPFKFSAPKRSIPTVTQVSGAWNGAAVSIGVVSDTGVSFTFPLIAGKNNPFPNPAVVYSIVAEL